MGVKVGRAELDELLRRRTTPSRPGSLATVTANEPSNPGPASFVAHLTQTAVGDETQTSGTLPALYSGMLGNVPVDRQGTGEFRRLIDRPTSRTTCSSAEHKVLSRQRARSREGQEGEKSQGRRRDVRRKASTARSGLLQVVVEHYGGSRSSGRIK